jgi:intracellular multiplication protein IcmO
MAVAEQKIRGLEAQEELFEKEFIRDTRSLPRKVMDFVAGKSGATAILLSVAGLPLFLPETTYMVPFIALPVYLVRKRKTKNLTLPFRMPITSNTTDYSDPVPGRKKFGKAEGIFFLGNEYKSAEELWLKGKDILTHMLVFGTTGSGKTEALVSLAFNAVAMGSGFFYIDPKAAPKLAMQVYKMARVCGRDDDFLVLSYSTAGKERIRTPKRLSNTTNPFAFGSPEGLTNLIVSLIPTSEGDNAIFSQNAQTLVTGLMYAVCELRDRGDLDLSIVTLREHMTLAKYVELAERDDLSETSIVALQSFLTSVGWQEGKPLDKQPRSLPEQFGYARSYFGLTLASLENSYGHIYKTPSGEVDMYDVIKNRRILVTLLPSLEKAPAELSNLGKISLSGVRLACSVGLPTQKHLFCLSRMNMRPSLLPAMPKCLPRVAVWVSPRLLPPRTLQGLRGRMKPVRSRWWRTPKSSGP